LAGECPGRGWWWWSESKESNTPPSHPECMKKAKNRWFWALIDLKMAENAVLYVKYLPRYTLKTFYEEYMYL
jgi:hypothetical protein